MARYRFEAVDAEGRKLRGETSGAAAATVEAELEGRGLLPLRVRPVEADAPGLPRFGLRRDVLEASRSISALLNAGLPLSRCLGLAEDHVVERIRAPLAATRAAVERGESLASALSSHPRLFPPIYRGMVRAGERSGDLAGAYGRLVEHLEREEDTRGRIVSASIYPALLVGFGGLSLLAIVLWVVPRFAELVTDAGASLPRTAAILVGVSGFVQQYWLAMVVLLGVPLIALVGLAVAPGGRDALSRAMLRIPVAGDLRRDVLASRFARMLGVLLQGGAPVLAALKDVEASVADPILAEATAVVRAGVRDGERLARAMDASAFYPRLVVQLVGIGEDSGKLPDFVLKAADIMDRRTEQRVRRLVALIEPAVIVIFGGLIALVAIALLQAVYGVNAGTFG